MNRRPDTFSPGHAARQGRLSLLAVALVVLAAAAAGVAADLPAPPRWYCDDRVGLVDEADAARLAEALAGFQQRTGIQFVVTVLPELDGDLETYVTRLYEGWGVGKKSSDRGVLFAVFPREGQSRLEVGYGLEDSLPDVVASRILRRMTELPRDPAAARLTYVIREVAGAVAPGDPLARGALPRQARRGPDRSGRFGIIPFLFIFFVLMALRGRRSSVLGPLIIASALSRRGGGGFGGFSGGGGGGFGGFSGGGGMSGGGGASGGW